VPDLQESIHSSGVDDSETMGSVANWREIAISNNVGGVKHFLSTLQHALEEERHFALVGGLRFPTWARF
jgi:hypothetical protein